MVASSRREMASIRFQNHPRDGGSAARGFRGQRVEGVGGKIMGTGWDEEAKWMGIGWGGWGGGEAKFICLLN